MDLEFFARCLAGIWISPIPKFYSQIYKDVRDVERTDFEEFDGVVYLVAESNDPMRDTLERLTNKAIVNPL